MSEMSNIDMDMRCLVGELVDFVGTHGLPEWMNDQLRQLLRNHQTNEDYYLDNPDECPCSLCSGAEPYNEWCYARANYVAECCVVCGKHEHIPGVEMSGFDIRLWRDPTAEVRFPADINICSIECGTAYAATFEEEE